MGAIGQDKKFWKSLDELAESPSYKEFVEREFPESASELLDPVSRRSFMSLMASSPLAAVRTLYFFDSNQKAIGSRKSGSSSTSSILKAFPIVHPSFVMFNIVGILHQIAL